MTLVRSLGLCVAVFALAGCAEFRGAGRDAKQAGRDVGAGAREVTKDIGHTAQGVARDIGAATREAARDLRDELKKDD